MLEIPKKNVFMRCEKKDARADAKRKTNLTWLKDLYFISR